MPAQHLVLSHTWDSVPISLTMHGRPYPLTLCLCAIYCWLLLFTTAPATTAGAYSAAICAGLRGGWCPPPAVVTGVKYRKGNASYTPQTGEVHGTALIFSLFHTAIAWLFNPCLTAWIIRKRDINAFNVYTRWEYWLLTRSKKNNEMP